MMLILSPHRIVYSRPIEKKILFVLRKTVSESRILEFKHLFLKIPDIISL